MSRLKAEAPTRPASAQAPLPRLSVTLPLRLLTPIIGGGVRPMEPDRAQPVRVTALRGALRWWWRALQATPDLNELREDERLLFGGVARKGETEDDNMASLVRVGVVVTKAPTLVPAGYHQNNGGQLSTLPEWAVGRDLGYALFPLQLPDAARREWSQRHPGQAAPTQSVITSLEFTLSVELDREALVWRLAAPLLPKLRRQAKDDGLKDEAAEADARAKARTQVIERAEKLVASAVEALRWWLHWGGVGARTRRGFGAVALRRDAKIAPEVSGGEELITPEGLAKPPTLPTLPTDAVIPRDRPSLYGAKILRRTSSSGANDAAAEHSLLIKALRDMRQKPGYARDPGQGNRPGETRWPEAELMKHRLTQGQGLQHTQRVPSGERDQITAPRAAFGLPIVMHFKDRGDGQANGQIVPALEVKGKRVDTDRWASPVLLRPQQLPDGKLVSGVLILSGAAVPRRVEVKGARSGGTCGVNGLVGARETIQRDLRAAGGDALRAFATRLRGEHGFVELPSTGR